MDIEKLINDMLENPSAYIDITQEAINSIDERIGVLNEVLNHPNNPT